MKTNIFLLVLVLFVICFTDTAINCVTTALTWAANHATVLTFIIAEVGAFAFLWRIIFKIGDNERK